jgi:ATP-dependent 26S proteasome regulatory subunit
MLKPISGHSSSQLPSRIAHPPKSLKKQLSVVHNVLMIGLPGAGKILLVRAMPRQDAAASCRA